MSPEQPNMDSKRNVVLIHGLFLNHDSWDGWIERYKRRGVEATALPWPGLEGSVAELRTNPEPLTQLDIKKVLEHLMGIIKKCEEPPIIIGHSFGGLFAQLLAYHDLGAAIVGVDSTAPAGVLELPFSTLKASAPVLANPLNLGKATMLTPEQFHYAFTNTVSEDESKRLYDRYAIPCANRVLFEGAFENFAPHSPARIDVKASRPPVLLIAGGADHLVTPSYTRSNFELIAKADAITAHKEFQGRPHFTGAVQGWEEVADYALDWALNPVATQTTSVG
jgi:pimeloyl-ACP methyl ester carboxylesterase